MYETVLQARERVLGPDHPSTLATMNNLAAVENNLGRFDEARQMYETLLQARERVLGLDHPSTLATMNNLAAVENNLGRFDEARQMYETVLQARERVLGPDHPSTLATMNNLAAVENNLGRFDEARQLRRHLLATRKAGLLQAATVAVVGEESESQLPSLETWLNDDAGIGGRVRLTQPQPEPGSMGTMANALAVSVKSGAALVTVVQALITWLRSRKSDVRVVITNARGERLELSTKNVRALDQSALTAMISRLTDSLQPDDGNSSEE
jgi:tetratricopeptide (TPR) repeat protein